MLRQSLGVPVVLLGLALPDDRAHAPNERLYLPNLWQGIDTLIWFLREAAHLSPQAMPEESRRYGRSAPLR
jgi:acetylornithine deacetylase/succinyl-diaminopimelate desuccinylase-like protein